MTISIRLEPALEKRLAKLAAKTKRTKSYYLREAILSYLEDMEDRYLALARLEKPGKRLSMEEAERALGLDN